jgi:hypothetical protein
MVGFCGDGDEHFDLNNSSLVTTDCSQKTVLVDWFIGWMVNKHVDVISHQED